MTSAATPPLRSAAEAPFSLLTAAIPKPELRLYSWLCTPGAMVNWVIPGTELTAPIAEWITKDVDAAMRQRFPTAERYIYLHDFSGATSHETAARKILTDWGIASLRAGIVDHVYVVPPPGNRLFMMGASAALMVLRAVGMRIEFVPSAAAVIQARGLVVAR